MRMMTLSAIGISPGATAFGMRSDSGGEIALAALILGEGERIVQAALTQIPQGVRIRGLISDLPPGLHAADLPPGGGCRGLDFRSSGEPFYPFGKEPGAQTRDDPLAGDLPIFEERQDETPEVEVTSLRLTPRHGRNPLLPSENTCSVIYDLPDVEATSPTENAESRIAWGLILKQ